MFSTFQSPVTHQTYRDVPSTYILTTKDQAIKYEHQLKAVQQAGLTTTKIMETGHSPLFSRPKEVKISLSLSNGATALRKSLRARLEAYRGCGNDL